MLWMGGGQGGLGGCGGWVEEDAMGPLLSSLMGEEERGG